MTSCTESHDNCLVIKRLLTALSYYCDLDTNQYMNHKSTFNNFMDTIYKYQVYDDYFHLMKFHQNDIESIAELAVTSFSCKPCDLSTCSCSDRHVRVGPPSVNKEDSKNKQISEAYRK